MWHCPSVGKLNASSISLDGLPSYHKKGPFIPGKDPAKYTIHEIISQYITFLKYIPYRDNKYTVVTMPGN